jgi:FkbM family methyltransferase
MEKHFKSLLRRLMPRTIRKHRIWAGPLRGQQIVTSWHDYPTAILGRTERFLLAWFQENVALGDTWLDVGAHYGYTAIALSRMVGPHGRVFAFEPMFSTAGHLAQTRLLNHLPQLTVLPLAVASPEALELKRLPSVRGMIDSTLGTREWSETILVARLDWLWSRIRGDQDRIDGVKIDVQGMEIEVLRGMSDLLKTLKPKLVIELHHGVARRDVLELLEAVGYSRCGIPIEPAPGETDPLYLDDRNYEFRATTAVGRPQQAADSRD